MLFLNSLLFQEFYGKFHIAHTGEQLLCNTFLNSQNLISTLSNKMVLLCEKSHCTKYSA